MEFAGKKIEMDLGFIFFFLILSVRRKPRGLHRTMVRSEGPAWITEILVTQDDIKDHPITLLWTPSPSNPDYGEHVSRSQKNRYAYNQNK